MAYLFNPSRVFTQWRRPLLRRFVDSGSARMSSKLAVLQGKGKISTAELKPTTKRQRLSHSRGQNLSERYLRLQTSLRGKETRAKEVEVLETVMEGSREDAAKALGLPPSTAEAQPPEETASSSSLNNMAPTSGKARDGVQLFKGLAIPPKPEPPADDECCMSGCAICVYDLYEESLEAYDKSVAQIRKALVAMGVQEKEWPTSILPDATSASATQPTVHSTVRDAFEEMERALQKKRDAQEAVAKQAQVIPSTDVTSLIMEVPSTPATAPTSS